MRKTYFTLLLAGMVSLSASAQQKVKSFPKYVATQTAAPMASPASVPSSIDDKALGTQIFATQFQDESKFRSWLTFYDQKPYELNRIKIYENEVGHQSKGLLWGAFCGDKYYAVYGSYNYNYGGPYEWCGYDYFGTVDVRTGEFTPIKDFRVEGTSGLVSNPVYVNQTGEQELPVFMDFAYNPSDGLLYGVARFQKDEYTNAQSRIYTIDTATGEFSLVTTLDAQVMEFCFDYDGNMYTIEPYWKADADKDESGNTTYTWSGTYIKEYDANFELVDGSRHRMKNLESNDVFANGFGSMEFNHSTGELYWTSYIASDNTGSGNYDRLMKINPATGKLTLSNTFMGGNEIVGMYIPYYEADAREAAGRVSDLTATPDATGKLSVDLSWTNPTKAWNGTDLTELADVQIYRKNASYTERALTSEDIYQNSTLVGTAKAGNDLIGKTLTWKDENPNNGMNVYYIVPCRVSGEKGVPDSIRCVAGADIPGAPTDFTAAADGDYVKLTWTAPVDGKNNGFVDPASLTYDITRNPGDVKVATDVTGTTFTDESVASVTREKFTYTITAKSSAGVGDPVESNAIEAGQPPLPPVTYSIDDADDASQWTALEDFYGDGQTFEWLDWNQSYRLITGAGNGEDWAVSPAFRLKKGQSYLFTSGFRNDRPNVGHTIGRYVGTAPTIDAMTNKIGEETEYSASNYYESNPIVKYEDKFTAPEDGTYYFGFRIADNTDYDVMYFYGVEVEPLFNNDLKAVDIQLLGDDVVSGDLNHATAEVKNNGAETAAAGSYRVQIMQKYEGTEYVVGEAEQTSAIRSGATAEIPLTFKPMGEDLQEFAVRVIYDKDEFNENNMTEYEGINVIPFGEGTPWSLAVTDGDEWESTYFPFSFCDPTDGSQSIYTKSDFADKGDVTNTIERIGFEYTGNDLSDALPVSNVTIWMANTALNQFTAGTDWVDESTLTQVFNGDVTLYPGEGNILSFQLTTPFEYDDTKNLLICVEHQGTASKTFPALWRTFNANGMRNRSIRYWSSMSNKYTEKNAPVLYVGFTPNRGSGINEVNNTAASDVYFDAQTGKLVLNGAKAEIYDLSGKLLRSYNNASEAMPMLPAGMYIIRAHAADGSAQSLKLNVK